jgi:hypothetical protein
LFNIFNLLELYFTMKLKYFTIFIICIITYSCSKESNTIITQSIPFTPNNNIYNLETYEDSVLTIYTYSAIWRLTTIQKIKNEVLIEKNTYNYSGNTVTVTSNIRNTFYKYYLNKNGYADSLKITEPGLLSITEKYLYNNLGMMIRKNINALINNVPYSEYTDYIYQNGNLIKSEQMVDNDKYTIQYEYYTDSINVMAGTMEANTFIPQSKNLIKKETTSDDTFKSFTYTIDDDGNWVTSVTNELDEVNTKTTKLIYIK